MINLNVRYVMYLNALLPKNLAYFLIGLNAELKLNNVIWQRRTETKIQTFY